MIMARHGGDRDRESVCVLSWPSSPWLCVHLLFSASHSRASSTHKGLLCHQKVAQKSHRNQQFCTDAQALDTATQLSESLLTAHSFLSCLLKKLRWLRFQVKVSHFLRVDEPTPRQKDTCS